MHSIFFSSGFASVLSLSPSRNPSRNPSHAYLYLIGITKWSKSYDYMQPTQRPFVSIYRALREVYVTRACFCSFRAREREWTNRVSNLKRSASFTRGMGNSSTGNWNVDNTSNRRLNLVTSLKVSVDRSPTEIYCMGGDDAANGRFSLFH